MNKLELMETFMKTFVGDDFHLIIREHENSFSVHTIEIIQKIDDTCPVKDIPIGDHFLHLIAVDRHGEEASMICSWSQELLQNLLMNRKLAQETGQKQIVMVRNPMSKDPNSWMLLYGDRQSPNIATAQPTYVS